MSSDDSKAAGSLASRMTMPSGTDWADDVEGTVSEQPKEKAKG
jgi:hypothetical protein